MVASKAIPGNGTSPVPDITVFSLKNQVHDLQVLLNPRLLFNAQVAVVAKDAYYQLGLCPYRDRKTFPHLLMLKSLPV